MLKTYLNWKIFNLLNIKSRHFEIIRAEENNKKRRKGKKDLMMSKKIERELSWNLIEMSNMNCKIFD